MNDLDVLNKMADIELPAPPDWLPVIYTAMILLIVFAAILFIFTRFGRRRHGIIAVNKPGNKVLEEIEGRWSTGRISDREASYQLATLLRLGLDLPQLNTTCPAGVTAETATWEKTIRLFDQLRYKKVPAVKLSTDEFNHVRRWLSRPEDAGQQP